MSRKVNLKIMDIDSLVHRIIVDHAIASNGAVDHTRETKLKKFFTSSSFIAGCCLLGLVALLELFLGVKFGFASERFWTLQMVVAVVVAICLPQKLRPLLQTQVVKPCLVSKTI